MTATELEFVLTGKHLDVAGAEQALKAADERAAL